MSELAVGLPRRLHHFVAAQRRLFAEEVIVLKDSPRIAPLASSDSVLDKMCQLALSARAQAYAPYSKHPVGAVLRSADGRLFSGCNVENAAYPLGQCAEASAIGAMVLAGAEEITDILVIGPGNSPCTPCGGCRQKLWEFASEHAQVHLCVEGAIVEQIPLAELLPSAFGRRNIPPGSN